MDTNISQDQSEDVWSRPNWPSRLEKIFVELLIEEMKNHLDVIPSGFNDEAWDRVCKEFNEETSLNYDKMELKKHLAVLRKRYRIVKPLYNHGGFGWDYRRKMVDVDDLVWAEYIEVHPEIKPYRKWGCPIYEELCTIFTKPKATGEHAFAVGGYRTRSCNSSNLHSKENVNISVGRNKRQLVQPSTLGPNKRNHKGAENPKTDVTLKIGTATGSSKAAMAPNDDPYSTGCCITIINGMQGVDRRLYNAAVDLFQNPSWRKTFMSLKSEKRLTWLKAMLLNVS
uniref:Myb/SANT-like domain-containing protein n=1 Tax=Davidia involucrata TaxID=16924 RepID=A0A5B7BR47_DAVIN